MNDPIVMLIVSMAANLGGGMIRKLITNRTRNQAVVCQVYNFVTSLTAAAVLVLLSGFPQASGFTLLLGLVFGGITACQQMTTLKALEYGPLSYTTLIISLSMLIPTLSGAVLWQEQIHPVQWAGIVLMIGCLWLSVEREDKRAGQSLRWLLFCGFAFCCTGLIGVMQKWHQNTVYKEELDAFLLIAFLVSAACSGLGWVVRAQRAGTAGGFAAIRAFRPFDCAACAWRRLYGGQQQIESLSFGCDGQCGVLPRLSTAAD